jgi:hypothetical protein
MNKARTMIRDRDMNKAKKSGGHQDILSGERGVKHS